MSKLKRLSLILLGVLTILALTVSGLQVGFQKFNKTPFQIVGGVPTIYLGKAYAVGTVDYPTDGTNDNVEWQAALNALPASGGKLVGLAGTYNFSAAVSRAIDNVTIEGAGLSSVFDRNAADPLFDLGARANWVIRDLATDAGGIETTGGATNYTIQNVKLGTVFTAYYNSDLGPANEWQGVDRVYVDSVNGVAGDTGSIGTPGNPVSNLTDALAIAGVRKLITIYIKENGGGGLALPSDLAAPLNFIGCDPGTFIGIDLNGKNTSYSFFKNLYLFGDDTLADGLDAENCILEFDNLSAKLGMYTDCILYNDILFKSAFVRNLTSWGEYTLTCPSGNPLELEGVTGRLIIAGDVQTINVHGNAFSLTIDASCTAGTINIYGDVDVTDNSAGTTVNDYTATTQTDELYQNVHSVQRVAPDLAAGITLTSGAGAWTLGAAQTIIAANSDASGGTQQFDIHGIDIEAPSVNTSYQIRLFGTVNGAANTEIGNATFTRTNAVTISRSTVMQTPQLDIGSDLTAKLATLAGAGTETCDIKVWYHNYQ